MPRSATTYWLGWAVVGLSLWGERTGHASDTLQDVRESVRGEMTRLPDPDRSDEPHPKSKSKSEHESPSYFSRDSDCHNPPPSENPIASGIFAIVAAPFWVPYTLLDEGLAVPGHFPGYPHQYHTGYQSIGFGSGSEESPQATHWLATRFSTEYGSDFRDQDWYAGRLLVESLLRFGIEADTRNYIDHIPFAPNDSLWLGDVNLFYRFAQSEYLQFRSGVGMNWLSDRFHTDTGFNFTYAVDWYPIKPLVSSTEVDLGWLGDAGLTHFRTTLGMNWRHAEVFVGWDYYNFSGSELNGLVSGVRLWW